jgi:circadian clock protein KaiC
MRSIGIDLNRWVKKGLLHIESARPSAFGLEMHLVRMHHLLETHRPRAVVIDPISGLLPGGSEHDVHSLVLRIVDFLKHSGATGFFTSLSEDDQHSTSLSISSLVDAWVLLRNVEANGERNRVLYVLKSRGMAHSNQIREFLLTDTGVRLREVYIGPGGVLTGSARIAREAAEQRESALQRQTGKERQLAAQAALRSVEARIAELEAEKESRQSELVAVIGEGEEQDTILLAEQQALRRSRGLIENPGRSQRPNGREGKG